MIAEAETTEYLDEIRKQVCSRCVERPPGGPPCAPLGKNCGVELHLEELIESIHQVHSNLVEPYLEHNRKDICEKCAFLHSSICPCPMDYLSALVIEAVETVDQRHQEQGRWAIPPIERPGLEEIRRAFDEASGTWQGCDWPTHFGRSGLDLNGCTAAEAAAMSQKTPEPDTAKEWFEAATWLRQVEQHARLAQARAAEAVELAAAGQWADAMRMAQWAWALEFSTGRPLRHGFPLTWQRLRQLFELAMENVG